MKITQLKCDICNKQINSREFYYLIKKESPFIFLPIETKKKPKPKIDKEKKLSGQVKHIYHFCNLEHLVEWVKINLT